MLDKHGYVLLKHPAHPQANRHGYVREHRLVMEQTLGRFLTRLEVVHHLDGNRGNNAPENLELFASNADHLRAELTGVPCPARGRKGVPKPRRPKVAPENGAPTSPGLSVQTPA